VNFGMVAFGNAELMLNMHGTSSISLESVRRSSDETSSRLARRGKPARV
jgi:hypothetical protein